jgi:hypothetical protein
LTVTELVDSVENHLRPRHRCPVVFPDVNQNQVDQDSGNCSTIPDSVARLMADRQTAIRWTVAPSMAVRLMAVRSMVGWVLMVELMAELMVGLVKTVELMVDSALRAELTAGLVKTDDLTDGSWMEIARLKDGSPHHHD